MPEKIAIAYAEVYELLQHLGKKYVDKIPEWELEVIEKHRDKSYDFKINPDMPDEQIKNMSRDGLALVAHLNLEYWASSEERERLLKIYEKNEQKHKLAQYEKMLEEEEN